MKISNIKQISKAYVEGIYADTPANRKLGRVGMSYKEWDNKIREEKKEREEKKDYVCQIDDDEFLFKEGISKSDLIEEASKYVEEIAEANDYDKYEFDIQEDTSDWSIEDIQNKDYEWLRFRAVKHGNKYEVSVFDYNTNEYLRNDTQKREEKNLKQSIKRSQEKLEKEFNEKFGWMDEYLKYRENLKNK